MSRFHHLTKSSPMLLAYGYNIQAHFGSQQRCASSDRVHRSRQVTAAITEKRSLHS
ncbi:hypothetical protein [Nostoc sp.]|uniref:hypothetical protein n=1 Tax=Nostoc sp. TaxID=1180 RepID=UPI002FF5D012